MKNILHTIVVFMLSANLFSMELISETDSTAAQKNYSINEIVVSATRTNLQLFDVPKSVMMINSEEILKRSVLMMPDALEGISEISMQRTTLGGGAPILRGLVGQYNLILIDGIRVNNSTWRTGPNQYFNTIDPNLVERIEIVNGPGSVLYGSDALGGVINIITKRAPKDERFSARSTSTIASASKGIGQNLWLGYGGVEGGALIGMSYKKQSDLRAGQNVGVQSPTGFSEFDANARLEYSPTPNSSLAFIFQSNNQYDVPRYDRIQAGNDIKNVYSPQQRHFADISYSNSVGSSWLSSFKIDVSLQRQLEGSNIISTSKPSVEIRDRVSTLTTGFSLSMNSIVDSYQLLTYGLEVYADRISSTRDTLRLASDQFVSGVPLFPNLPLYQSSGFFLQDQISFEKFFIIAGVRYSAFKLNAEMNQSVGGIYVGSADARSQALCGNLNVTYKLIPEQLNLYAGISQGFRAPNAFDLLAIGNVSHFGVEVPNSTLQPERSTNYEIGLRSRSESWGSSTNAYYVTLTDFIQRQKTYDENNITVFTKQNVNRARVIGASVSAFFIPQQDWTLRSSVSWTRGDNLTSSQPLPLIPPLRGTLSLEYVRPAYWCEILLSGSAPQHRLSNLDSLDSRIGPNGTAGFVVPTIRGGVTAIDKISINFGIENIFDKMYKTHGSGIFAPGRNFLFGITIQY